VPATPPLSKQVVDEPVSNGFGKPLIESAAPDAELSGCARGRQTCFHERPRGAERFVFQFWSSWPPAFGFGGPESVACALGDESAPSASRSAISGSGMISAVQNLRPDIPTLMTSFRA
jgi:hypothetical protein